MIRIYMGKQLQRLKLWPLPTYARGCLLSEAPFSISIHNNKSRVHLKLNASALMVSGWPIFWYFTHFFLLMDFFPFQAWMVAAKPENITCSPISNDRDNFKTSSGMPSNNDLETGQVKRLKGKIRKWEVFPGRNRFYCNGVLMLSTQTGIFYFALFLIVVTSACFFAME